VSGLARTLTRRKDSRGDSAAMDTLMRMQNSFYSAQARKRDGEITVEPFTGKAAAHRGISRGRARFDAALSTQAPPFCYFSRPMDLASTLATSPGARIISMRL
jgi:hypothetical protein